MEAGTQAVAEYDIDRDAWYFEADRGEALPFAILLEIALAAVWLAGRCMGSSLNSPEDLQFRNLGGRLDSTGAFLVVSGTLTTRVKATKITSAAGMILQWYEFSSTQPRGSSTMVRPSSAFFPHTRSATRSASATQPFTA